jgi:NAD dependent epimerase/dehydratase family
MDKNSKTIFLTGGTGYMGSQLAPLLLARGHEVRALTRIPSVAHLPTGCHPVFGNAVSGGYESHVPAGCTFIHPGHRWPYTLVPLYWLMERIHSTRERALRLGLVTLSQMLNALVISISNPCMGLRILDVPAIRRSVQ